MELVNRPDQPGKGEEGSVPGPAGAAGSANQGMPRARSLEEEHMRLREAHAQLLESNKRLAGRHAELNNELIRAREEALTKTERIALLDKTLYEMVHSRSWRLTGPLRYFMHKMRNLRNWFAEGFSRFGKTPQNIPPEIKNRIVLISGEETIPGHIYRMKRLAEALSPTWEVSLYAMNNLQENFVLPVDTAVIWIWRASIAGTLFATISQAKAAGIRIIFDVDDMCFLPEHFTTENMDALRFLRLDINSARLHALNMENVARLADLTVATTAPLAAELFAKLQHPSVIIRNTFDNETRRRSSVARRGDADAGDDGLIRIGYAAGTPTHQADLKTAAKPLAQILSAHNNVRLVLFDTIDLKEIPELQDLYSQIEYRPCVPLPDLPAELARFDINIVPLERGNKFCECKSELKFFEAALLRIPTVASATRPFRDCIINGKTGFLAATDEEWVNALSSLIGDSALRSKIGSAANRSVQWYFGPEYLRERARDIIEYALSTPENRSRPFNALTRSEIADCRFLDIPVPDYDLIWQSNMPTEDVAVVIPLYNYEEYIGEALDSLLAQTLDRFNVIVVDDCSTDNSGAVARAWLMEHSARFASATLLRNRVNSGLAMTRNAGIDYADGELIMLLDADNKLLPDCLDYCRKALADSTAAFVYPGLEAFGSDSYVFSDAEWEPMRLRRQNYIDAMAMLRKPCWASVGGYTDQRSGWEDYDLWCKFAERGFWGKNLPEVLAMYRVHPKSMRFTHTDKEEVRAALEKEMAERHRWLNFEVQ